MSIKINNQLFTKLKIKATKDETVMHYYKENVKIKIYCHQRKTLHS